MTGCLNVGPRGARYTATEFVKPAQPFDLHEPGTLLISTSRVSGTTGHRTARAFSYAREAARSPGVGPVGGSVRGVPGGLSANRIEG